MINAEKIITDKCTTYAVEKKKPEKIQSCQNSNPDLCNTSAASKPTGSWSLNWFIIYQGKMKIFIISSSPFLSILQPFDNYHISLCLHPFFSSW